MLTQWDYQRSGNLVSKYIHFGGKFNLFLALLVSVVDTLVYLMMVED